MPEARNVTLAAPTITSAPSSAGSVGASAASKIAIPKANPAPITARVPTRPVVAATRPPITAPTPIAPVITPYTSGPPPNVSRATTGSTTWNS